jgi:AP2-associated kinase
MRRGRVPVSQSSPSPMPSPQPNRPSPSPGKVTNGDPFAALDARAAAKSADELSNRFPTLDQFSLLHDKGQKFEFDDGLNSPQQPKDLSQRVAERLADEAFLVPSSPPVAPSPRQSMDFSRATPPGGSPPPRKCATATPRRHAGSRAAASISNTPELQAHSQASPPPSKPSMVSIGTMTSPTLDQAPPYQIQRFPSSERHHRAASVPRSPAI